MIFEPCSAQHLAALEVMARAGFAQTFGHLYTVENLQQHLDAYFSASFFADELRAGSVIEIARVDDAVVGYIKYGQVDVPVKHEDDAIEIHRLYVRSDYQGKGISQHLMAMALQHPRLQAASGIFLGVWENNHKAQAFYGKHGFEVVGEYLYRVGTHADRELIMQRVQS